MNRCRGTYNWGCLQTYCLWSSGDQPWQWLAQIRWHWHWLWCRWARGRKPTREQELTRTYSRIRDEQATALMQEEDDEP